MVNKKKQYIEIEKINWGEIKFTLAWYLIFLAIGFAFIIMILLSMFIPVVNRMVIEDIVKVKDKFKLRHKVKYEVKNFKDKE